MSLFKHSPQQKKSWNLIGRLIVRALDIVTGTELVVGTELVDVASAVVAAVLSGASSAGFTACLFLHSNSPSVSTR